MTETAYRDYLARQDFKWWTGSSANTFSRKSSTGGTMTVTKIGNSVDVLAAFGDGIRKTSIEINQAIDAIGSNNAAIEIAPGAWDISADVTFPSNTTVIFHPGAYFVITTAKTVTFDSPDSIIAPSGYQIFSGAGTAAFTYAGSCFLDWWGAAGDDSTNDTTAVAAAIGDLAAGSIILVPPGKTYIATAITVNKKLIFRGPGSIKQMDSGASADTAFITVSADDVWFDGITLDGNSSNQGAVTGAHIILLDNGSDNCKITNCVFKDSTSYHIYGYGVDNLEISNNKFTNWRAGTYAAIYINNTDANASAACYYLRISGNYIDGSSSNSTCISIHGTTTYPIYDVIVENNNVVVGAGTNTLGIELWSSSAGVAVYNATVTGNIVTAENSTNTAVYGISFGGYGVYYGTILGNSVKNCNLLPIELTYSKYITASSNSVHSTGTPAATNVGIKLINSSNCVVDGNTVKNYTDAIGLYAWSAGFNTNENIVSNNIVVLQESTNGTGITIHASNATAKSSRNHVVGNTVVGDGTASQSGVLFEYTAGTMSDNMVSSNYFENLTNGVYRTEEDNTIVKNNYYETVSNLVAGTGGTGESLDVYKFTDTNGTVLHQMGDEGT